MEPEIEPATVATPPPPPPLALDVNVNSDVDHPVLLRSESSRAISDKLQRVTGVLQDMADVVNADLAAALEGVPGEGVGGREDISVVNAPMSPGIPPAAFGAGGPM
jgi:hypothetical protein